MKKNKKMHKEKNEKIKRKLKENGDSKLAIDLINGLDLMLVKLKLGHQIRSNGLGGRGCMIEHAPRHTGFQGHKYPSSVPIPLISNFNSLSSLLLSRFFFLVFLLFSSFDFFLDSNKTKKNGI
jgi:hypothetical protein